MTFWYIFLALIIIFYIYMSFEVTRLKIEKYKVNKNKNSFKVIHLSDIHIKRLRVSPIKIKNAISSLNPDIVILSGDYIESKRDIALFISFLGKIKGTYDIFLCFGNHDFKAFLDDADGFKHFIQLISSTGVKLLQNEAVCIEKNNKKYNIIGISDMRYGNHDIKKALNQKTFGATLNIAFSHNPDIVFNIPKNEVDYLLCGHFHGGQIWAPFNIEFKLMRNETLCKLGIYRGLNKINGISLYINRGIGNVLVPLRFMSIPEIAIFYF